MEINQDYLEVTGHCETDLLNLPTGDAAPAGIENIFGNENIQQSLKKVLKSGKKDITGIFRHDLKAENTSNFNKNYWKSENRPVYNSEGEIEYILHIINDVTAQVLIKRNEKKASKYLLKKQQQYQYFIEENHNGLFSMDLKGNFLSGNNGLVSITETPLENLLNKNSMEFVAPAEREKIKNQFEKAVKGEHIKFEGHFITSQGTSRIMEISLAPMIIDQKMTGLYGIARDLTNIKEKDNSIFEKKKFLEVNAAFISSLVENDLEDSTLEKTFGIIGKTIAVDRMYYFGANKNPESGELLISQKLEWCSEFATSQKDNPEMQNMPASRIEQINGPLSNNTPFMANLCELPECDLKEIFKQQQIKAMLLLPIFLQENLYGFIGFDDCQKERQWTADEITFLQSLAYYFTNAVEKKAAQHAVKQKEEELRRSEEKFKALVQEGSDLIAILDPEGVFTFTSGTSTSALGITPTEFLGKKVFDFIHPEDQERVLNEFEQLKTKKQAKTAPFRFRNKEGNWRWIETAATNLLHDPAINGIVINSRDITTIIEQAREIEHINERYILAASATQDLIYDWDLVTNEVVRFHRGLTEMLGHPASELDKRNFWYKNIHPDEFEERKKILEATLADPKKNFIKTQYRFRRADGTYAYLIDRGHIIRNHEGKAIRLIGATSDLSKITAQKEALKSANTRFKLAMKATREMIWDWDIMTETVNRSKSFAKIYGYESSEKSSMAKFWLPKILETDREKVTRSLKVALENEDQNEWKQEYRFVKADGTVAFVMDRGYIIRDKNKKPTRMVGAVLDVTASRRLIKDIKKQNDGLKEIAWAQSHIVRAPLARLKGLVDLLEMEELEEVNRDEIIENIKSSADELDNILRGIVHKTEKIEINHQEPEEF
jgi:PAS domain S-box-containing protein